MKKPISRFYLLLVLVPLLLLASMGGYYFLEETAAGSDQFVFGGYTANAEISASNVDSDYIFFRKICIHMNKPPV